MANKKTEQQFFDLRRLASSIHGSLEDKGYEVFFDQPVLRAPRKNPFLYAADKFNDRIREQVAKYDLMQEHGGLFYFLTHTTSERQIGYAFVEQGIVEASASEPDYYEALTFRIKQPLELKGGVVIPSCSVKLYMQSSYDLNNKPERRDHVRKAGLIWQKANLMQELPTEWFLREQA